MQGLRLRGWSRAAAGLLGSGHRVALDVDRFEAVLGDAKRHRPTSSSRRQTGSEPAAGTSSSRLARMSLSTTFRAASPLIFAGSSTPRSSRCEAADRITSCLSVSFDIGILRWVAAASLPPPPQPRRGHAAGGAGSRGAPGARNGHTTAPFADECQSFLDNFMLVSGRRWLWRSPSARWRYARECSGNLAYALEKRGKPCFILVVVDPRSEPVTTSTRETPQRCRRTSRW